MARSSLNLYFLNFPPEIRVNIYRHLFEPQPGVTVPFCVPPSNRARFYHHSAAPQIAILQTCQTCYQEATPILYSLQIFRLTVDLMDCSILDPTKASADYLTRINQMALRIGKKNLACITRLYIPWAEAWLLMYGGSFSASWEYKIVFFSAVLKTIRRLLPNLTTLYVGALDYRLGGNKMLDVVAERHAGKLSELRTIFEKWLRSMHKLEEVAVHSKYDKWPDDAEIIMCDGRDLADWAAGILQWSRNEREATELGEHGL